MRKVFKAIKKKGRAASVCEKRFVGDNEATPKGWHDTPVDALAAANEGKKQPEPEPESAEA